MWSKYTNYSDALKKLNLQTLDERRQSLCVTKKCLITEKLIKIIWWIWFEIFFWPNKTELISNKTNKGLRRVKRVCWETAEIQKYPNKGLYISYFFQLRATLFYICVRMSDESKMVFMFSLFQHLAPMLRLQRNTAH